MTVGSNWMRSNAAATREPVIKLQKLGTLASYGFSVASCVRHSPPFVCYGVSLVGIVSYIHELMGCLSSLHVVADARFSLPAKVR